MREIIVDNFAGGGGTSEGIRMATGRSPDIAINHDPDAIAMHTVNHPETYHYCEDVWAVDPVEAAAGRLVGLCWLSPDCKHFSKAKGGKPVDKNIRGLAWVAVRAWWTKDLGQDTASTSTPHWRRSTPLANASGRSFSRCSASTETEKNEYATRQDGDHRLRVDQ